MGSRDHNRRQNRDHNSSNQQVEHNPQNQNGTPAKPRAKHDRKNMSTRIISLRKLLSHAGNELPADVRAEKERELAALQIDQESKRATEQHDKMVGKYHFIRFIERKKAERALKSAKKRLEAAESQRVNSIAEEDSAGAGKHPQRGTTTAMTGDQHVDTEREELKKQLHNAEVDLNYTLYAPLNRKYHSIFVTDAQVKSLARVSPSALADENGVGMGVRKVATAGAGGTGTEAQGNNHGKPHQATNIKPPLWYLVEHAMTSNSDPKEQIKALEALRDTKSEFPSGPGNDASAGHGNTSLAMIGGKKHKPKAMAKQGLVADDNTTTLFNPTPHHARHISMQKTMQTDTATAVGVHTGDHMDIDVDSEGEGDDDDEEDGGVMLDSGPTPSSSTQDVSQASPKSGPGPRGAGLKRKRAGDANNGDDEDEDDSDNSSAASQGSGGFFER